MNLLDNNLPIAAFRPDHEHHAAARQWLESALNNGGPIRLVPTVEAGFLRVVTHARIFNPPSSLSESSGFLRVLCLAPNVEISLWTPACRERWLNLCAGHSLSGNDCNDAMLAAVALEKGLRMVTFDKGFRRFPDLKLELLEG